MSEGAIVASDMTASPRFQTLRQIWSPFSRLAVSLASDRVAKAKALQGGSEEERLRRRPWGVPWMRSPPAGGSADPGCTRSEWTTYARRLTFHRAAQIRVLERRTVGWRTI